MRLAEAVGALALAADVSNGLAVENSLRNVLVAARLARMIAGEQDAATIYWASVLRAVGCLGFAPKQAGFSAGDDNRMRRSMTFADFSRPLDTLAHAARGFPPESALIDRARGMAQFLNPALFVRYARSHCESAMFFARTVGMPEAIAAALDTSGERFDGKGARKIRGDDLPWAARVADVAEVLELFAWTGGPALARSILRQRRGRALDPAIVDVALAELPALLAGLTDSVWDEYLALESLPWRNSTDDADRGLVALGRFADLKSLFTLNHSRRVIAIAEAAGRAAGLGDADCSLLRGAGAVHDLGRVAIATGTWDKKGRLNSVEWQRGRRAGRPRRAGGAGSARRGQRAQAGLAGRAVRSRGGGGPPGLRRTDEPRDRCPTGNVAAHGAAARDERLRQAGPGEPRRRRALRHRARPAGRAARHLNGRSCAGWRIDRWRAFGHLSGQQDPMENMLKTYVIERPVPGAGKMSARLLRRLSHRGDQRRQQRH